MSFKNHFSNTSEKISNLYEALFEASETYYNLTGEGLKQIFDQTFTTPPKVSKATNLIVLNPANEEDKKVIKNLIMVPVSFPMHEWEMPDEKT